MKTSFILPLLLLGVAGHASMALAQSPNTFTATGDMSTPRYGHTATLLTNGKVLIAGGSGVTDLLASAELYDPATGTFTATGSMATSRIGHTATLLPNGKVLIAGGAHDRSPDGNYLAVASAELYDPSSGTFTATGDMTAPRDLHTATLLPDGRVLIAGGRWVAGGHLFFPPDTELYDPSTGTFTGIGSLGDGYHWSSTTLLADGRVLMVGITAHLYDPGTGRLSDPIYNNYLGDFGVYFNPRTTLLMNGKVLFAGYDDYEGDFWGPGLFDPSTEIFTSTGNMRARRGDHTATLLPDGTVLIGGRGWYWFANSEYFYSTLNSAELYDPVTSTFSDTGNMATDRDGHTATLLSDGSVLLTGGSHIVQPPPSYVTVVLSSAEIYHPGVLVAAPVLLTLSGDGRGQAAIQHADTYQLVSASNPAVAGEALIIYCTGLADGSVIPPQVAIGGSMAEVLWFGTTPGFVGLNQINVRVPSGIASGDAVPVQLNYIGRPSNEVTISVLAGVSRSIAPRHNQDSVFGGSKPFPFP